MVRIVIEVPYQHKELAHALHEAADRVIAVAGRSGGGKAVD